MRPQSVHCVQLARLRTQQARPPACRVRLDTQPLELARRRVLSALLARSPTPHQHAICVQLATTPTQLELLAVNRVSLAHLPLCPGLWFALLVLLDRLRHRMHPARVLCAQLVLLRHPPQSAQPVRLATSLRPAVQHRVLRAKLDQQETRQVA